MANRLAFSVQITYGWLNSLTRTAYNMIERIEQFDSKQQAILNHGRCDDNSAGMRCMDLHFFAIITIAVLIHHQRHRFAYLQIPYTLAHSFIVSLSYQFVVNVSCFPVGKITGKKNTIKPRFDIYGFLHLHLIVVDITETWTPVLDRQKSCITRGIRMANRSSFLFLSTTAGMMATSFKTEGT